MLKKRIYLISGLGADQRAFGKLSFPADFELVHLDWIPELPKESLPEYAKRLSQKIDTSAPFYLIGLSFGGMLATEIAKNVKPRYTFLISSVTDYRELPWYYQLAGRLSLQKMLPVYLLKRTNILLLRMLGAKTEEEKKILRALVTDSDPNFMKWAMDAILHWRNTEQPSNLVHFHGTADHILPLRYVTYHKPDVQIKNAGHFMVFGNAAELSSLIIPYLNDQK